MDRGFIVIWRKIVDNPVATNLELLGLFVHLISIANHRDNKFFWNGKLQTVKKGEILTGRKVLAAQFHTTESRVFRKIRLLEQLGLISVKSNNRFSIISIVKYSQYQNLRAKVNNKRTTDEQQMNTNNHYNHYNHYNQKERETAPTHFVKPSLSEVIEYWSNNNLKGGKSEAEKFFYYYESNGWRVGKSPMKNWKAAVRNWQQRMKDYGQPNITNSIQNGSKFRRCPSCNNYLTNDGICYVPECSSNKIQESIKKILEN